MYNSTLNNNNKVITLATPELTLLDFLLRAAWLGEAERLLFGRILVATVSSCCLGADDSILKVPDLLSVGLSPAGAEVEVPSVARRLRLLDRCLVAGDAQARLGLV